MSSTTPNSTIFRIRSPGAVRAAARRGVWMVNIHASGGGAMLRAAREAAETVDSPPLLIGVTVLTSIDEETLNRDLRISGEVADQVTHLARLSEASGLDGVVASALELPLIHAACGPKFLKVIPGIRPAGVAVNDQKRIATPEQAVRGGASYLVIGRAITAAPDPAAAADAIGDEVRKAIEVK